MKRRKKEYIGNAAVHGQMATVFAKLIIGETDYGVNAFLVPLTRDTTSKILQGITIGDCGLKWDLTALIMAQLVFENVLFKKIC
jgi:acyl-CoA oxidase